MKIIHYCHQLGLGGTEKNMQYLLEYLQRAGHDCYSFVCHFIARFIRNAYVRHLRNHQES